MKASEYYKECWLAKHHPIKEKFQKEWSQFTYNDVIEFADEYSKKLKQDLIKLQIEIDKFKKLKLKK